MSGIDNSVRSRPLRRRDGLPDFRSVEKPEDSDFEIEVTDCGCMRDWCDGTRWEARVEISGESWSVKASTHYPYVMVHVDHRQKKKYHPVNLDGDDEGALRRSFWREVEALGYDGERYVDTDSDRDDVPSIGGGES